MERRKTRKIYRGEIYYYDFGETKGSLQKGVRPVAVLQTNSGYRKSPTVIVAPITSILKKSHLSCHIYLGLQFGLKKESMLLLEQIQTVNKSDLGEYVGTIGGKTMLSVNEALKEVLKLKKSGRTGDVRCLCNSCLSDYINSGKYFVRRLDPFAKNREKCDKCNNVGWDYILFEKRKREDKNA